MLHEHRVLTVAQIAELAFDSVSAAQHRLVLLYRHRAVDRFRPFRPTGSAPFHYVLDRAGAALIANERGIEEKQLDYRRDKALAFAHSQRLAHHVAANGFFTALAASARRSGGNAALTAWWPETRCAAAWERFVRPDGYGCWRQGGRTVAFFLECDRGTETHDRLNAKLDAYTRLRADSSTAEPPGDIGAHAAVLFWFPNYAREQTFHRENRHRALPVATAVATPGARPDTALWWPLAGHSGQRLPLTALAPTDQPDPHPAAQRAALARNVEHAQQHAVDPTWPPPAPEPPGLEALKRFRLLAEADPDTWL